MARKDKESGFLSKLMFWKDNTEKPEQYRIKVVDSAAREHRDRAGSERRARPQPERREDPRRSCATSSSDRHGRRGRPPSRRCPA